MDIDKNISPKVITNLVNAEPFKISLRDSSPDIQLGPSPELVLLWPDNSCLVLHLDDEDMASLKSFLNKN